MSKKHLERVIGTFEGSLPGPLIIVTGAMHGNEPAGVHGLEIVFEALEQARRDHPDFQFRGTLLGIIANAQAFLLHQRFLEQDLNRVWTPAFLENTQQAAPDDLLAENREAFEIYQVISNACQTNSSEKVVFLDLHTTSAEGGVFSIPTDEGESLELAKHLGAPVILGLQQNITGTFLGFAINGGFCPKDAGGSRRYPPICVAFEAGQHDAKRSINQAANAVIRCLRTVGCLPEKVLVDFAESIQQPFLAQVPPVVQFRYAHHIEASDGFKMRPGYANFQPVQSGEHLADDVHGPVLSPEQGLILMPLYQAKGSDGFFIVR